MIRTERLILRRWRDSDREPFAAMNGDPAVVEHLQGPMSRERSDGFVDRIEAHWEEHGWGLWAVEVPGVAPFIGYVGLWPADHVAPGMVEVGWRLAREHWGHGYATEAARALAGWALSDDRVTRVVATCEATNTPSIRVLEKIGMARTHEAKGLVRWST